MPRPQSLALPVRDVIRYRSPTSNARSIGKAALIAAKVIAERTTVATYWTADELRAMLQAAASTPFLSIQDRQYVIVAERAAH